MHSKFPKTVMVLGIISNEGHVMPPHFFPQGLRLNANGYIEVLETVVKPWIQEVAQGRPFVFQQDSAPSHTAHVTQEWLSENFYDHVTPNMWPPNSPDLNPLDYFFWGMIERETNLHAHNTTDSLKAAVIEAMSNMCPAHVIRACNRFRARIEAVLEAQGGFIE